MKLYIKAAKSIKPLSDEEIKRNDETLKMRLKYENLPEYYKLSDNYQLVYQVDIPTDEFIPNEAKIYKRYFVYTRDEDENGNYVRRGSRVPDSTYYSALLFDDPIDEVCAYKTLKDAKHALQIELDWYAKEYNFDMPEIK